MVGTKVDEMRRAKIYPLVHFGGWSVVGRTGAGASLRQFREIWGESSIRRDPNSTHTTLEGNVTRKTTEKKKKKKKKVEEEERASERESIKKQIRGTRKAHI